MVTAYIFNRLLYLLSNIEMEFDIGIRPKNSCGITISGESSEHKPDAGSTDECDGAFHHPVSWYGPA